MPGEGSDPKGLDADALARAEAALARLADDYAAWLRRDLNHARACLTPPCDLDGLRTRCHDIKGQAQTFGYPLITRLAQDIGAALQAGRTDPAFFLARLEAMETILVQGLTGDGGDAARVLLSRLD
jgi:Hpt domain